MVLSGEPGSITIPYTSQPELFAVMRTVASRSLLFVGNSNTNETRAGWLEFSMKNGSLFELISKKERPIKEHRLEVSCKPGECMLFELPHDEP